MKISKNAGKRSPGGSKLSRRQLLQGATGTGAIVLATPWIVSARSAETLVVNFYGGEVGEIFKRTTITPFEKKFGAKVIYDEVGSASQDYAKIRASRGEPGFDVAAGLTVPEIILGSKEGLLEKITEANVPNVKYQWEKTKTSVPPFGIVQHLQYCGLYYNHDKIARPESWLDYWQPQEKYGDKLKGHLLQVKPGSILCHFALIMGARSAGGDINNLKPAFEFLEKQKPYIGLSEQSSSKMAPYFENEEIWLSPYWSARAALYISRGFPMTMVIPKEGSLLLPITGAVPIGAKNKKLAFEFLNFRLEKDVQREFCLSYNISPGRADMGDWPEKFAQQQLTTKEQMEAMLFPDYQVIAAKRQAWSLQWQKIMAS
jgi:putative spermidine/putrescine transport system substrate-binding protein